MRCTLCRRPTGSSSPSAKFALCARCSAALTADGRALLPDVLAPEALTAEIIDALRGQVARAVGGMAIERELTAEEIDALLGPETEVD